MLESSSIMPDTPFATVVAGASDTIFEVGLDKTCGAGCPLGADVDTSAAHAVLYGWAAADYGACLAADSSKASLLVMTCGEYLPPVGAPQAEPPRPKPSWVRCCCL